MERKFSQTLDATPFAKKGFAAAFPVTFLKLLENRDKISQATQTSVIKGLKGKELGTSLEIGNLAGKLSIHY